MAGSIFIPMKAVFDDKGVKDAQKSFGNLGKSMKGVLATAGIAVGLAGITNILKESAKAASEDVKSQALLAAQLKNTVGATDEQTAAVEKAIGKMQLMSSVADDNIRPAFATLLRSTKDIGQATAATTLALDVAAGTGKDLGAVSLAMGKAIGGSNTSLLKLIPSLKGAKDPLGELQKQFAGMAATAANADPFQRMQVIFGDIQEQIGMALLPALQELATWLASDVGQNELAGLVGIFKDLAAGVGVAIIWLKDNYKWIMKVAGLAALVMALGAAFEVVTTAIKLAAAAQVVFAAASALTPWGMIALAIGAIGAAWIFAANGADKYAKSSADATDTGSSGGSTTPTGKNGKPLTLGEYNATIGKPKTTPKPVDETTKAMDELKAKLAAINNLNGSSTKTTVAKKAADTQKKIIQSLTADVKKAAQDLYDANKKAFDEQITAIDNLKTSMKDLASAVKPLPFITEEIGSFQQSAIDSFDEIGKSITENSAMFKDGGKSLLAYVATERNAIQAIAKQRDELAKKYSLAKAVKEDVAGSIVAMGNLTNLLQSQTDTVTETISTVVDGISVVRTKTFEQTKSSGDIVSGFKAILDKAKTFAKSLTELKKLGLNGTLFKQIVDSGADAGTATADAIIAGGAGAVTELNSTFADLQAVGTDIGEQTATVMYGAGIDLTNGLLEGIKSKDKELMDTATAMASAFATAFNDSVTKSLIIPSTPQLTDMSGVGKSISSTITSRPDPTRSPQAYANWLSSIGGIDPIRSPQAYAQAQGATYNVTVNAGAITDQASLPSLVTNALMTANKQGLTGGLSRVLAL